MASADFSDTESEFSGFAPSDIPDHLDSVADLSDFSDISDVSSVSSDSDRDDDSDGDDADQTWSERFSEPRVRFSTSLN